MGRGGKAEGARAPLAEAARAPFLTVRDYNTCRD